MNKISDKIQRVLLLVLLATIAGCSKDDSPTIEPPIELPIESSYDGGLAVNGNFESGVDGWIFFSNGGTAEVDDMLSNGEDTNSARIVTNGPSNPGIKQERIGIDTVQAGDVVQIQFDHIGSYEGEGGIFNVLLFIELADGAPGIPITHIFDPKPTLTDTWSTFTGTYTIPNDAPVTGGISFLIESVCGGVAGCAVSANVDNVSVFLNP